MSMDTNLLEISDAATSYALNVRKLLGGIDEGVATAISNAIREAFIDGALKGIAATQQILRSDP